MPMEGIFDEKFEEKCEESIQRLRQNENSYIIVKVGDSLFEEGISRLVEEVNNKKKEGYVCIGGHVITTAKNNYRYYYFTQSMELKN